MKILLFGATGMIGQAVLKEALRSPGVEAITIVGRSSADVREAKASEVLVKDLFDLSAISADLAGHDACLFCIGVSSAFMDEAAYTRLTYDLTLSVARAALEANPGLTFVYVTGQGTDSSGKGSTMWARVKGRTENALLAMPFKAAYMFRPGAILPLDGIRSKTPIYDFVYRLLSPLVSLMRAIRPAWIPTTREIGKAMLHVASGETSKRILDNADIVELARASDR